MSLTRSGVIRCDTSLLDPRPMPDPRPDHRRARRGPQRPAEGRVAHPAAPLLPLRHRLPRPRQRRLRQAADAGRPGVLRDRLRRRRRAVLRRLHVPRNPRRAAGRALERAEVVRAHPRHVGHLLDGDGAGRDADAVLRRPVPARAGRGRVLPRRDRLLHALVPAQGPRPGDVRRCSSACRSAWRSGRACPRCCSNRLVRPQGLAVGVPDRGCAGGAARASRCRSCSPTARARRSGSRPRSATGSKATLEAERREAAAAGTVLAAAGARHAERVAAGAGASSPRTSAATSSSSGCATVVEGLARRDRPRRRRDRTC